MAHLEVLEIQFNEIDIASDKYRNARSSQDQAISRSTLCFWSRMRSNDFLRLYVPRCNTRKYYEAEYSRFRTTPIRPVNLLFLLEGFDDTGCTCTLRKMRRSRNNKNIFLLAKEYTEAGFTIRFDVIVKGKLRNPITCTHVQGA